MEWDFSLFIRLQLFKSPSFLLLLDDLMNSKAFLIVAQADKVKTRGQFFHIDLLRGIDLGPSHRLDSAASGIVDVSVGETGEFVVNFYIDYVMCRVWENADVEVRQWIVFIDAHRYNGQMQGDGTVAAIHGM